MAIDWGNILGGVIGGVHAYNQHDPRQSWTKTSLPEWQKPLIQQGMQGAQQLYEQGAPMQTMSNLTQSGIAQLASPGAVDPYRQTQNFLSSSAKGYRDMHQGAAGQYFKDVMGGKYLNGNPHLDAVISNAQKDVTSGVNSQYALGGRGGSAANARALATSLGDMSSQLRYGDYANERANMGAAAQGYGNLQVQGGQLANQAAQGVMYGQDKINQNAKDVITAGQGVDAMNYANAQAPWQNLANYLNTVGGNYGGTTTSYVPTDRYGDTVAGAAGGSGIWDAIGGIIGNIGGDNPWIPGEVVGG